MVGKERNIAPEDVDMLSWIVPLLVGAAIAAVIGLVMFEVFLRWNQGQELRQALITLAIAVILADQMLARAGGLAQSMSWPEGVTHFVEIFGQRYATSRLFILAIAIVVGALLWLWLNRRGWASSSAPVSPTRRWSEPPRHQHRHRVRRHVLRRVVPRRDGRA